MDGGIVDISIEDDRPAFRISPAPKPQTKAERKAAKLKWKGENANAKETANSQEN